MELTGLLFTSFRFLFIFFLDLEELLESDSEPELELELLSAVVWEGEELADTTVLFVLLTLPSSHFFSLLL